MYGTSSDNNCSTIFSFFMGKKLAEDRICAIFAMLSKVQGGKGSAFSHISSLTWVLSNNFLCILARSDL
jgi:hypothetical protein